MSVYYNYDRKRDIMFRINAEGCAEGSRVKIKPVRSRLMRNMVLFCMIVRHLLGKDLSDYICFIK